MKFEYNHTRCTWSLFLFAFRHRDSPFFIYSSITFSFSLLFHGSDGCTEHIVSYLIFVCIFVLLRIIQIEYSNNATMVIEFQKKIQTIFYFSIWLRNTRANIPYKRQRGMMRKFVMVSTLTQFHLLLFPFISTDVLFDRIFEAVEKKILYQYHNIMAKRTQDAVLLLISLWCWNEIRPIESHKKTHIHTYIAVFVALKCRLGVFSCSNESYKCSSVFTLQTGLTHSSISNQYFFSVAVTGRIRWIG